MLCIFCTGPISGEVARKYFSIVKNFDKDKNCWPNLALLSLLLDLAIEQQRQCEMVRANF